MYIQEEAARLWWALVDIYHRLTCTTVRHKVTLFVSNLVETSKQTNVAHCSKRVTFTDYFTLVPDVPMRETIRLVVSRVAITSISLAFV